MWLSLLLFWTTGMCTESSLFTPIPPPHLPNLFEGRCAQATLKVKLDNKPTYSSTATDPVNIYSGVALANHCQ